MELEKWKAKNWRARDYAHFDNKVSLKMVWDYINNPEKVKSHSFYPFILNKQKFNKYNKDKGIVPKERDFCYSAHIDRYIFQFYGFKLNQFYNLRLDEDGVNEAVIAYRNNLGKSNIHFAKQAINFIRELGDCYIIVGDFTDFFGSLDHSYLKGMLKSLLETKELPPDYYAVFKNVTKFSTWDIGTILELNGLPNSIGGIRKLNKLEKALSLEQFKANKKKYVFPHDKNYGIPQGSAISAVLSNIYMMEFDKLIFGYVSSRNGLYMRYSDDIIIVLPKEKEDVFKEQFDYIKSIINLIPNLVMQPDKTKIFEYNNKQIICYNELVLDGIRNSKNSLDYLGFSFDGKVVTIRDKTLSKYHYRMNRKLKTIIKNDGFSNKGNKISCKEVYRLYSIKGADKRKGNFITYVQRAERIFGNGEAINRGTKNHMQKIRKKLHSAE